MVAASFTGNVTQRIDAKGRVSIPADFRKVLEAGDPEREAGALPAIMLSYSPHLKTHLKGYTVAAFEAVGRSITAIEPRTPEQRRAKEMARRMHFGCSCRLEIDRDGRVVMPAARRAQLGVAEGELVFFGAGDSFEIWSAATYEEVVGAEMFAFLGEQGDDFDPADLASMLGA